MIFINHCPSNDGIILQQSLDLDEEWFLMENLKEIGINRFAVTSALKCGKTKDKTCIEYLIRELVPFKRIVLLGSQVHKLLKIKGKVEDIHGKHIYSPNKKRVIIPSYDLHTLTNRRYRLQELLSALDSCKELI